MSKNKISVTSRENLGRGANRRLRAAGSIPAVIYGKSGNFPVSIDSKAFGELWSSLHGHTPLILVEHEGKETRALIQEVERDPIKDYFIHVDLHEVAKGEEITVNVALNIVGEADGVKNGGGTLEVHNHEIEVRCLPRHIPDHVDVDVSSLKVSDQYKVSDLPKLEGVTYGVDDDEVIAAVVFAKATIAAAEEAEAEAEAASES